MDVVSPVLPTTTFLWRSAGKWARTVICKGTFVLEPATTRLSADQDPINPEDQHWDDDPARSLYSASDLAPVKRRADVILVGHAFAPERQRVRSLIARMAVDEIDKSIAISADRSVGSDGAVYEGAAFSRMPLVYERAAGGPGSWNPVGVRPDGRDAYGNRLLPNLTPPGKSPTDAADPIGFGPIPPSWPTRSDLLVHEGWSGDWMRDPLPDYFDLGFFNVAPVDQQLQGLRDDAMLHLENLHPEHALLTTTLPGIRPRVVLEGGGRQRPLPVYADSLVIDTDRGIGTLVWRGHLPIDNPREAGRVVVDVDQGRAPVPPRRGRGATDRPEATALHQVPTRDVGRASSAFGPDLSQTTSPFDSDERSGAALPFGQKTVRPAPSAEARRSQPFGPDGDEDEDDEEERPGRTVAREIPVGLFAQVTPFGPAASIPKPPPSAPAAVPIAGPPPAGPMPAPPPRAPAAPMTAVAPAPVPLAQAMAARPHMVQHASTAALGGVAGASNAAADPALGRPSVAVAPAPYQGDILQLLWFEPEAAPRVRRRAEWKKLLDELDKAPPDAEADRPGLTEEPGELEDRREVFEVLARGKPSGEDGVLSALSSAVRSDGRFAPQLLLLAGEVRFDFDEIETLKANVGATTPLAGSDEELKSAIEQATKLLATPDLLVSADIVEGMSKRIRDAFAKSARVVGPTYLEEQTERALIERRAYQRRDVFGQKHLRALFFHSGSTTGVPTYLPEALAKKLPLFRRLRVKMLVEAHFQADQYEAHSAALKAAAVARVVRAM